MVQWLDEVVGRLQGQLQQWNLHRPSDFITWSWVCVKLLNLLANYPCGVTSAIILSELHQELHISGGRLPTSKRKLQKKATVSSILDSNSVIYEAVLEVHIQPPFELPGTTTIPEVVHLTDHDDDTRYLKMYLHRKFYNVTNILTTHTLRMTCCYLVPTSVSGGPPLGLTLLPTEHFVIVLDREEEFEYQNSFTPLGVIQHGSITTGQYIDSIYGKVIELGSEEFVHSTDGMTFKRLIVQLADPSSEHSIRLLLWDSYVGFSRLFEKGDTLYLERPYAKPSSDGWFCLEHGPATVFYIVPFEPPQESVPSQHPQLHAPLQIKRTDDGKLDFNTYPERLTIASVVPNMINGVILAQCLQIDNKEFVTQNGCGLETFKLYLADHTDSIGVVVFDCGARLFESLHCNQWLLLCGVSSHTNDRGGGITLTCHLGEGGSIHNVSSLYGRLMSPSLCIHTSLRDVHSAMTSDFTTAARITGWFYTSVDDKAVEAIHCTCRRRVKEEKNGLFSCQLCRVSNLEELKEPKESRDESKCWRWQFTLGATLQDDTGSVEAELTPTAAEVMVAEDGGPLPIKVCLQRFPYSAGEFSALSSSQQLELLQIYIGHGLIFSICWVKETLRINCVAHNS